MLISGEHPFIRFQKKTLIRTIIFFVHKDYDVFSYSVIIGNYRRKINDGSKSSRSPIAGAATRSRSEIQFFVVVFFKINKSHFRVRCFLLYDSLQLFLAYQTALNDSISRQISRLVLVKSVDNEIYR